jgi:murein DD-endopeptidase MepM/ murein hydrolase activator NlpD
VFYEFAPGEHEYVIHETIPPTCVTPGIVQIICIVCSYIFENEFSPQNDDHIYQSPHTNMVCTRYNCGFINGTPGISSSPDLRYFFRGEKLAMTVPDPSGHFGARNGTHFGIDITYCFSVGQGIKDMPIYSVSDGYVKTSRWSNSAGNIIEINRGNRTYVYMHLNSRKVNQWEIVTQTCLLGTVGDTGTISNGYHLHFEIHVNELPQDPFKFFPNDLFKREWWDS